MLTAVFDIGKTNKKFLLFDQELNVIHLSSVEFEETIDDDGFPCDDLDALTNWIRETLSVAATTHRKPGIGRVNFSTYGASLVHVGADGRPVAPLYNYLKPYPPHLIERFHELYGGAHGFATATASPSWGMLNSGLQLYWLKEEKREVFDEVRWSLHLPQYCSYLLTGHAHDESTSLGCHTGMWDFQRAGYHAWLDRERVSTVLPKLSSSTTLYPVERATDELPLSLKIGAGVHDSSSALYPYLRAFDVPFLFVSTGTWVVTMNPFAEESLSGDELDRGALCYLTPDRNPVKSVRLFLGAEHALQVDRIAEHFGVDRDTCLAMGFDGEALAGARQQDSRFLPSHNLVSGERGADRWRIDGFATVPIAYHALVDGLVDLQLEALQLARGSSQVSRVFIDGGFSQNKVFTKLLAQALRPTTLETTGLAQATALGAALLVNGDVGSEAIRAMFASRAVSV